MRIDYLPLNPTKNDLASNRKKGYYVLVETKTPSGYQKAAPKPVIVEETAKIQLYGLENRAKSVYIFKLGSSGEASEEAIYLAGAELAVFRAAQDGSLTMLFLNVPDNFLVPQSLLYGTFLNKKELLPCQSYSKGPHQRYVH